MVNLSVLPKKIRYSHVCGQFPSLLVATQNLSQEHHRDPKYPEKT